MIVFFKHKAPPPLLCEYSCWCGRLHQENKLAENHCFSPGLFLARSLPWTFLVYSCTNRCVSKMHRVECVRN